MRKSVIIGMIIMMTMIIGLSECCLESEKIGLLEIKDKFKFSLDSALGRDYMSIWGSDSDSDSDCCSWPGVVCDSSTGHVTRLFLSFIRDLSSDEKWYLNASLFLPFPHLYQLDLSRSGISGCTHNEGFERLSTLTNLEILDLTRNHLNNSILQSLSALPFLKYLYLGNNTLNETTDNKISGFETLSRLTNLEILDLSYNNLNNSILQSLSAFPSLKSLYLDGNRLNETVGYKISGFERLSSTLTNLEILDLSDNNLNNSTSILQSLGAFPSLKSFKLRSNGLNGTFNISELVGLSNLEKLSLSRNEITEFIGSKDFRGPSNLSTLYLDSMSTLNLPSLAKFPSIKTLSLRENHFQGQIFHRGFVFESLEHLYLDNSAFDGINVLQSIGIMRSLKTLTLPRCGLNGSIPTSQGLCQLEHLEELDMQDNDLSGNLPWCFANFTSLKYLDLSRNLFNGKISSLESLTSLQYLYLSHNLFQIPISLTPLFNFSQLTFLHIDNNTICAEPEDRNLNPKFQLQVLSLNGYGDVGAIPKFLYHQHNLQRLVISHIKMRGMFPYWLLENNTRIQHLDLTNNSLSGPLLLPNKPLFRLSYLVLGHNNLQGQIPIELCKVEQLSFRDLSHNRIFGNMLSCLNFTSYSRRHMYSVLEQPMEFTVKGGAYSNEFKILRDLTGIDVSCNMLTGQIPSEIGDLRNIKVLNFSHNSLIGRIPPTFSDLKEIESLDLSYNNLQGTIPHQLTQLTTIEVFNVSYNNLSGQTPDNVKQFATFDESSYKGNPFLCGWPLPKSCNEIDPPVSSTYSGESIDTNSLIDMEVFCWSFVGAYGTVLMSIVAVLCINPHWRRVWFYYVQISIDNSYYFSLTMFRFCQVSSFQSSVEGFIDVFGIE